MLVELWMIKVINNNNFLGFNDVSVVFQTSHNPRSSPTRDSFVTVDEATTAAVGTPSSWKMWRRSVRELQKTLCRETL